MSRAVAVRTVSLPLIPVFVSAGRRGTVYCGSVELVLQVSAMGADSSSLLMEGLSRQADARTCSMKQSLWGLVPRRSAAGPLHLPQNRHFVSLVHANIRWSTGYCCLRSHAAFNITGLDSKAPMLDASMIG